MYVLKEESKVEECVAFVVEEKDGIAGVL